MWRQPHRSPLRAMAEGLLRLAETRREQAAIQAQHHQNIGQIASNTTQNIANPFIQTLMEADQRKRQDELLAAAQAREDAIREAAWGREDAIRTESWQRDDANRLQGQEFQVATTDAGRQANRVQADLAQARSDLADKRRMGAPSDEIRRQEALVTRLEQAAEAPLMELPDAYRQAMASHVEQPRFFDSVMERAGQFGPQPAPGTGPGPVEGITARQQLSRGAATAADLARGQQVGDTLRDANLRALFNLDPADPSSVYQGRLAADMLRGTGDPQVEAAAQRAMAAFEGSPEAQAMFDRAQRRDQATTQQAEALAIRSVEDVHRARMDERRRQAAELRAQESHTTAQRAALQQFEQIAGRMGDDEATRVLAAMDTGVLTALTDEGREEVAKLWGIPVEEIEDRAKTVRAAVERDLEIGRQIRDTQLKQAEQQLKVGEQNLRRGDLAFDRDSWAFEREKFLAPMQDGLTIATGLSNAATHGELGLLSYYERAFSDPENPLGQQMAAAGITPEMLVHFRDEAQEVFDLERERMRMSNQALDIQVESAMLSLEQQRALAPLETEALRTEFQLKAADAYRRLNDLAFRHDIDNTMALLQVADAVPPEYWDNAPSALVERMERLGLPVAEMRQRSEFGEWVRQSPVRQEAWTQFQFLSKAPPANAEEAARALGSAADMLDAMGITGSAAEGMLNGMANIWRIEDEDIRTRLANTRMSTAYMQAQINHLNRPQAAGGDSTNEVTTILARVANTSSSLATSLNQEAQRFEQAVLSGSGCQLIIGGSAIEGYLMGDRSSRDTPVSTVGGYDNCGQVFDKYDSLMRDVSIANREQSQANDAIRRAAGFAPVSTPPPVQAPSGGGGASNGPQAAADAIRAGNVAESDRILAELAAMHGEDEAVRMVQAILDGN